jgi:energy-coupling factor transporter ATP-binding protein EcfA2
MKNTQVVNLFGGPGIGKSKLAYALTGQLKEANASVELVTEVAKDYTYEKSQVRLDCQFLISGEQIFRIDRLVGQVDFIITDSPFLLGIVYNKYPNSFNIALTDIFNTYNNVNYLLSRERGYTMEGRNQTKEEAEAMNLRIESLLEMNRVFNNQDYMKISGDLNYQVTFILNDLLYHG